MNLRLALILVSAFLAFGCSSGKRKASKATAQSERPAEAAEAEGFATDASEPSSETPKENESTATSFWKPYDKMAMPDLERRLELTDFEAYTCQFEELLVHLEGQACELSIPTRNGLMAFDLINAQTMSPELAAKFPNLRSYKGRSQTGGLSVRLDTNDEGVFIEITGSGVKDLISPILRGSKSYYALYNEAALPGSPRDATYD